jgi:hypothetical protein
VLDIAEYAFVGADPRHPPQSADQPVLRPSAAAEEAHSSPVNTGASPRSARRGISLRDGTGDDPLGNKAIALGVAA